MIRFVLFIFLFVGSSTAFASDNKSKLGITERLRQISEEKNAAIILPSEPFGISLGSKFSPENAEVLGLENFEYYLTLKIDPKKRNPIFDHYLAQTSQDEMLVFQVIATSKTHYGSLETCISERDKIFKLLFRKYKLGSALIDVATKGDPETENLLAFETKAFRDNEDYYYRTMLNCRKDGSGDMRLMVIYMDVLLFTEILDEHRASLISNM